ncbi:MAG: DUF1294 domain-containing protein [Ruminococcus sp.]|nr:DUF1294 domain-containing protein [Ruminococcus sp.]
MNPLHYFFIAYFIIISIVAVIITCYDKHCAIYDRWRIKERTLLIVSALGGGIAMYVTMQLIRHKTKKLKFMLGIPLIVIAEIFLLGLVMFNGA